MPKQRSEQETYSRNIGFDMQIAFDASDRQEYIGYAYPGAKTTEARWQIYKLTYNANGQVETMKYADGTDDFTKIWSSRTSYDYDPDS